MSIKYFIQFEGSDKDFYPVTNKNEKEITTISQNSGSSNPGIFYQVGGGGVNGAFGFGFRQKGILTEVNDRLLIKLKELQDDENVILTDPLPSIIVPLNDLDQESVEGMLYSVGPVLSSEREFKLEHMKMIKNIYKDAISDILEFNGNETTDMKYECLRVSFVSSGIYGPCVDDEEMFKYQIAYLAVRAMLETLHDAPVNKYLHTLSFQGPWKPYVMKALESMKYYVNDNGQLRKNTFSNRIADKLNNWFS